MTTNHSTCVSGSARTRATKRARVRLAATFVWSALAIAACGGDDDGTATDLDASARDAAPPVRDGDPSIDGGADEDATTPIRPDGGGSSATPAYVAPFWMEPTPPMSGEVADAVSAVRTDAESRLSGGDVAMLETRARETDARTEALAQLADLRFDAAAWLLVESERATPSASALASMAGIEAMRGDSSSARAETLGRAAIERIGPTEALDASMQRVAASAWANVGHARLARGEAAGAVHAYERALEHFPNDAMYRTGLAASLAAADLPVLALQQALRARALELVMDPTLLAEPGRTPARDWVTHLQDVVRDGVAPPVSLGRGGGDPLPAFPAVGSELFGMTVLSAEPTGELTMSPPPFEPHGLDHGHDVECTEEAGDRDFACPGVPEAFEAWAPVGRTVLVASPAAHEEGTTCENAIERALAPELRPMRLMRIGPPGIGEHIGGLGFALFEEMTRLAAAPFGLGIAGANMLLPQVEGCSDFTPRAGAVQAAVDRIDEGCRDCISSCDAECAACFAEVRASCDVLFRESAHMVANEEARARQDDVVHQRNIERSIALTIALDALLMEALHVPCEETGCAVELDPTDYRLVYAEHVGGRPPGFLAGLRTRPALAYVSCVADIPPACPASSGGGARGGGDEVACVCLGAGPVSYCLQADGSFELTFGEIAMVGVRGNIAEGASSIRVGAGAGLGVSAGFLRGEASAMVWFDPSRGRFTGLELEAGVSIDVPGGGNVGATVECDAWRDDAPAREADPDALAVEATPPSP